jgi:hypothetical protein
LTLPLGKYRGQIVGDVFWQGNTHEGYAVFEFDRDFLRQALNCLSILMAIDYALRGDG